MSPRRVSKPVDEPIVITITLARREVRRQYELLGRLSVVKTLLDMGASGDEPEYTITWEGPKREGSIYHGA